MTQTQTEEAKQAGYVKFLLLDMVATIEKAEAKPETIGDAIITVQRRCVQLAEELSGTPQ